MTGSTRETPLVGRRCLVVGGARGIGAAVVRRLVADGAVCHATARSLPAEGSEDRPPHVTWSFGDVRSPEDVTAMAGAAEQSMGGVDALIYCPAIARVGSVESLGPDAWSELLEVNLRGFGLMIRALLPRLRERNDGRIIGLSSQAARRGQSLIAAYAATKAAMEGMVRALAVELAPAVRVNAVAPGIVPTKMIAADFSRQAALLGISAEEVAERTRRRVPLGRFQSGEAVAATVAFLIGPESADITGQVLAIDGGMTA